MPERKLVIVAAGAFAREVAWAAREDRAPWEVAGFLDDNAALHGQELCGAPVLGPIDSWIEHADAHFVIAIGPPRARRSVARQMQRHGSPRWGTIVHASAQMSRYVEIGEGSIICSNCSITTQVRLGQHTIINLNCTVGHDVVTGDYCTFAPLVACSGAVAMAEGVEIGTGAAIRQGLALGEGAMLGMGSVLTKPVPADSLWLGNPAAERSALPAWSGEEG